MKRARMIKALLLAFVIANGISAGAQDAAGAIRPAPYQVAWQDLEFGVIIHFSTNTFLN
jgi:alpha-L-fucosidase